MRRLLAALGVAVAALGAGPIVLGPAGPVALAHAQLVSSSPGSGEIVGTAPSEIRLVFSETIDPAFSFADVLNAEGRVVVPRAGDPDPRDPHVLVVPLPRIADGAYTVDWQTLSSADGHQASGFVSFGVGAVQQDAVDAGASDGGVHAHGIAEGWGGILEVQARTLADLGFLLAFGLLVIALAVLRPTLGVRDGLVTAQASLLLAASAGGIVLGLVAGSAPGLDPGRYLTGTRPGELLLVRAAVGVAGAIATATVLRARRPVAASLVAGATGAAGIVLLAMSGHASAFASPAPEVALAAHLAAAGVWVAGLVSLAVLVVIQPDGAWRRPVISRFSALALVSVALVVASGAYQAWVETVDPVSLATPYQANLWIKVALVAGALAIGAVNYVTAGDDRPRAGTFGRRVALETALAAGILVASANLASGSPPRADAGIAIAPAAASAGSGASFGIRPGRPGPNQLVANPGAPAESLEVHLDRLDASTGGTIVQMRSVSGGSGGFAVDGIVLPAGSAWDATLVARNAAGSEVQRSRFSFALDAAGLASGRDVGLVDPGVLVGLLVLTAGLLGLVVAVAGGSLPRVDRATGRGALLATSAVAVPLGLVLFALRVTT